jgi:hypothetical protein
MEKLMRLIRAFYKTLHIHIALYVAGALLVVRLCFAAPQVQSDDFVVYSPYVTQGQSEVEFRSYSYADSSDTLDGERGYAISIAHAFTDWWKPEIYLGEYQRQPGQGTGLVAYEFENTFQLTQQGEFWTDMGFLASYAYATQPGETSALEFGPLFEKRNGRYVQKLNFIWEKQIGSGAENIYEFRTDYSLSYQVRQWFAPGAEIYLRPHDNAYQIGPVLYGELVSSKGNELEYSTGVVFGANHGAPDQTFVLRLEYEFY